MGSLRISGCWKLRGARTNRDHARKLLDELFLAELSPLVPEGIGVIGSADVSTMLDHESQKALHGCDDTSCLAEIGNALGASHLVAASVGVLGDRYVITTKFIDVSVGRVVHRKALYLGTSERELIDAIKTATLDLARSQGWAAGATGPDTSTGAAGPGSVGNAVAFWSGVGLTSVGVLVAVLSSVAIVVFDQQAAAGETTADRKRAGWLGLGAIGGAVLGVGAAGGGAALLLLNLPEGGAE